MLESVRLELCICVYINDISLYISALVICLFMFNHFYWSLLDWIEDTYRIYGGTHTMTDEYLFFFEKNISLYIAYSIIYWYYILIYALICNNRYIQQVFKYIHILKNVFNIYITNISHLKWLIWEVLLFRKRDDWYKWRGRYLELCLIFNSI